MQSILAEMDKEDVAKEEVTIVEGQIHVGDGVYQKQVTPLDPTRILQLPIDEIDRVTDISHRAVFIVRKCGLKLNNERIKVC